MGYMKNESPLYFREDAKKDIVQIKSEIQKLEKEYDALVSSGYSGVRESISKSINKSLQELRSKLLEYFSVLKHDPTTIGMSVKQAQDELQYVENRIKYIDDKIDELNEKARKEFFKNDPILSDGTKNEEYYKIREELDPLLNSRNNETVNMINLDRRQTAVKNLSEEAKGIYESNDYKNLDYKLRDFVGVELAPDVMQGLLDKIRSFLAFCKERGEMIDIKPIVEQYTEAARKISEARNIVDNMAMELNKQGIKIKVEDTAPFVKKFEDERKNKDKYKFQDPNTIELHDFSKIEEMRGGKSEVHNIRGYEQEKIEASLTEVQSLADTMKKYIKKMKDLDDKNITVVGKKDFGNLRVPEALFEPGQDGKFADYKKLQTDMEIILDRINTLEPTVSKD